MLTGTRAKGYSSPDEMAKLLDASKLRRHGVRYHLLLMTHRHGLRLSEAVGLRCGKLDLDRARLLVCRPKGGLSVEQSITGDELRAIKRQLTARTDTLLWLFIPGQGQPFTCVSDPRLQSVMRFGFALADRQQT